MIYAVERLDEPVTAWHGHVYFYNSSSPLSRGYWTYTIKGPNGRYWQGKGYRTSREANAALRRALKRQIKEGI